MASNVDRRLAALEQQAQPERGGYAVQIGDGPDAIVTVDGIDMTLAEFERRYTNTVVIDIGGPGDATHTA